MQLTETDDTTWDPASFTIKDAQVAIDQNPFDIASFQGDISAFQKAGGKVCEYSFQLLVLPLAADVRTVHYHGQMDAIITSEISPLYYNHVSRTMALNSADLDEFYRFFRVSGMGEFSFLCFQNPSLVY